MIRPEKFQEMVLYDSLYEPNFWIPDKFFLTSEEKKRIREVEIVRKKQNKANTQIVNLTFLLATIVMIWYFQNLK